MSLFLLQILNYFELDREKHGLFLKAFGGSKWHRSKIRVKKNFTIYIYEWIKNYLNKILAVKIERNLFYWFILPWEVHLNLSLHKWRRLLEWVKFMIKFKHWLTKLRLGYIFCSTNESNHSLHTDSLICLYW